MEITHKRFNRVDLLSIEGRMDAASAPQLKQQIEALFDQGRYRLVLDMAKLEYIASPGLRVFDPGAQTCPRLEAHRPGRRRCADRELAATHQRGL